MITKKNWLTMLAIFMTIALLGACTGKGNSNEVPPQDGPQDSKPATANKDDGAKTDGVVNKAGFTVKYDKQYDDVRVNFYQTHGELLLPSDIQTLPRESHGYMNEELESFGIAVGHNDEIDGRVYEAVRFMSLEVPPKTSDYKQEVTWAKLASTTLSFHMSGPTSYNVLLVRPEKVSDYIDDEGYSRMNVWATDKDGKPTMTLVDEVVEAGLARVVEDPYQVDDKWVTHLKELEARAKEHKEGIWSVPGYVTDDGFDPTVLE